MFTRHALALLLLAAAASTARAADPPADGALKERGLRRAGSTYVLSEEAEVQQKLNRARTLFRNASAAAAQKTGFERDREAARGRLAQLEAQYVELNRQLSQTGPGLAHNQLVAAVNALVGEINILRRQGSDEGRQVVGARLASAREDFLQAVIDLRGLVDKVNGRYAALASDASVKQTLDDLNRAAAGKTKYALGPSRSYQANVALLEKVEASVLSEDVPLRKEGGVYWVDVTFNGTLTKPMVFDTGASAVVLPAELADSIGLKPRPDDQTVTAQVADGSKVDARKTVIPSVRVGKFTVENVECIVMPPGKREVPPLLGQTFQRNFSIKMNADAGKLVLSRVDAGEAESPAPAKAKSKGNSKTSRPRR